MSEPLSPPAAQGTVERTAPLLKDGDIVERLKQFRLRWQEDGDLTYLGKALTDAVVEIERLRKAPASPSPEALPASGVEAAKLLEWADDFEAASRCMARGIKRVVLATRAEECRIAAAALTSAPAPEDRNDG